MIVILVLVVCLVVFFFAVRQHRALRDSIVESVAALLRQIESVRDGPIVSLTVSLGVADYIVEVSTPSSLVEAADAAMYASKHAGRNRVALSSRPPMQPRLASQSGSLRGAR